MTSFHDHLALLGAFVDRRDDVVSRLETQLLNVQGKDTARRRDRPFFEQTFEGCFYSAPGIPREAVRLKRQLALKHVADGFEPLLLEQFPNELDPLELVLRAYQYWQTHRWAGRSGRLTYASNLFVVYLLRQLEYLTLRVWDDGAETAGGRLADIQQLLDRINRPLTGVFVRDARWLMHTAAGPVTKHLEPYFRVAEQIDSLGDADRLALHKAGARLAGGHLRSQLRYSAWRSNRAIDDPEILAATRNSNAMDTGLLIRDLVSLFDAYKASVNSADDDDSRLDLADAILQGLSADAELFVTRLDLLRPYMMVEDLFVVSGAGSRPAYTPMGERQMALIARYHALVAELADHLLADAARLQPRDRVYSPFAIMYGFAADILANMAVTSLVDPAPSTLSFEDTFLSRGPLEALRARATRWEGLPKKAGELEHFAHSSEQAGAIFGRLVSALTARVAGGARLNVSGRPDRRLFVASLNSHAERTPVEQPSDVVNAQEHCLTSDVSLVEATGSNLYPKSRILTDRAEGRFLASVERQGKWFAVSKVLLTLGLADGQDLLIRAPDEAADVLDLTCDGLVVREHASGEG